MIGLLLGIIFFELDIFGVFIIYLVVRGIFGLLGIFLVREWLSWPNNFKILKEMMPFAIPFWLICIAASFLPVFERNVALNYIGPEELGLFAAGAKVALIIRVFQYVLLETAWGPFSLSIFVKKSSTRTYQIMLPIFTVFICCTALFLTSFSELLLILLVSDKYSGAGIVVFAVCFTKVIQSIGGITGLGITLAKKSYLKLYSYLSMILVAFNLAYNVKNYGLTGLAYGSLIAMGVWVVMETYLSQIIHYIDWKFSSTVLILFITIIFGCINQITLNSYTFSGVSLVPLLGILLIVLFSVV